MLMLRKGRAVIGGEGQGRSQNAIVLKPPMAARMGVVCPFKVTKCFEGSVQTVV